jgi:hypothetical protein
MLRRLAILVAVCMVGVACGGDGGADEPAGRTGDPTGFGGLRPR